MFFFSPVSGVGHQNFVPLREGGSCFFLRNRVFISSGPTPPVLFDQPLRKAERVSRKRMYSLKSHLTLD